jgi:hypothetical protein
MNFMKMSCFHVEKEETNPKELAAQKRMDKQVPQKRGEFSWLFRGC